jgi:hypothetical protein
MHPVLEALVDVHPESCGFIILHNPFFDTDRRIPMLFNTFKRGLKRLVPKRKLLFVVVDPVVGART